MKEWAKKSTLEAFPLWQRLAALHGTIQLVPYERSSLPSSVERCQFPPSTESGMPLSAPVKIVDIHPRAW